MLKHFGLIFLFFFSSLYGNDVAEGIWEKALKFHEEAESLVRKGNSSEAIVVLNTSLDSLKKIQYEHPGWNSAVVRSRVMSIEKRIEEVEKLLLANFNSLSKEQLLVKLRESEVARAKFSKAMMIIYDKLKNSEEQLRQKSSELELAQRASGQKITDQVHLDKITFENLKLKKLLEEKEAQLAISQNKINEISNASGVKVLQTQYEQKLLELSKTEKELLADKQNFNREKDKNFEAYKEMSLKHKDLVEKEKNFESKFKELSALKNALEQKLIVEAANSKKYNDAANNLADKAEIAMKRVQELEAREKKFLAEIEALQKGKGGTAVVGNDEKLADLQKQLNRLKNVEVDLKAKLDGAVNEAEKNKNLLNQFTTDHGAKINSYNELEQQLEMVKKSLSGKNEEERKLKQEAVSLANEITSLKAQQKIQVEIIDSLKKKIGEQPRNKNGITEVSNISEQDVKLLAAYEKESTDLKAKLALAEKKVNDLEIKNNSLKKENLLGDEALIQQFVQIREEYRVFKEKTKELYLKLEKNGENLGEVKKAFSEDSQQEKNKQEQLQELLFQAQKAEKNKDFQTALGLYSASLQLDPKKFDALLHIGLIHFNLRHFQDATVHLKKAFYQEPDDTNLLLALGLAHLEQNQIELAISYLSRLVALKPNDSLSRLQLAVSLQGLGWTQAAYSQLKIACELDPKNGEAAYNLALVSLALPEPEVKFAKENYDRAIKLGISRDPQLEQIFSEHLKD